jgi:hypothetical protein
VLAGRTSRWQNRADMWSVTDVVDAVSHAIDVVKHPRFCVPLLGGIAIAAALWRWMPAGDARDVLVGSSIVGGLVVGLIWDWGR